MIINVKMMVGTCVVRLIGTEEVVYQMILFSHHVSSSASPTSMLMMIQVKEYHLMMIGMQHIQVVMNYKLVGTTDNDALYYVE